MLEIIYMVLKLGMLVAPPSLYWAGLVTFETAAFALIVNIAFDCHIMRFDGK